LKNGMFSYLVMHFEAAWMSEQFQGIGVDEDKVSMAILVPRAIAVGTEYHHDSNNR